MTHPEININARRISVSPFWENILTSRSLPASKTFLNRRGEFQNPAPTFNNHIPQLIEELATALLLRSDEAIPEALSETSPDAHDLQRLHHQFDLEEVVSEYNILRGCIIKNPVPFARGNREKTNLDLQGALVVRLTDYIIVFDSCQGSGDSLCQADPGPFVLSS